MIDLHVDLKSFFKGILKYNPLHKEKVNYGIKKIRPVKSVCNYWIVLWTPRWHKGRGPYISIGLKYFAFYRGY